MDAAETGVGTTGDSDGVSTYTRMAPDLYLTVNGISRVLLFFLSSDDRAVT